MDIHKQPIAERIDWLMEHARIHAESYSSPESSLARTRYLAEHPTDLVVLKCMDGRVNLSVATNTPQGIITPLRNLGGYFNLGWPHMSEVLSNHLHGVIAEGRRCMIMISYHYSKGSPERGCAGFSYDIEAAKAHTQVLKRQVEQLFGPGHSVVYPLVCGFETDEDALILHGSNGDKLDVSTLSPADTDTILPRLEKLYPDMSAQMRQDLLPLVTGNIQHVEKWRDQPRQFDNVHREWTICVGHVYDFLQIPNLALIIGPYSPSLEEPIHKAAGIIQDNMAQGTIPDDGFLLLTSAPYRDVGLEMEKAKLNSRFLSEFAADEIRRSHPELARKMHIRTAVMHRQTRDLSLLD